MEYVIGGIIGGAVVVGGAWAWLVYNYHFK